MGKTKTPGVGVEPKHERLRDLPWPEQLQRLARVRLEHAPRPSAPLELQTPAVYTHASALAWLARAEAHYGAPVTSRQVLEHALNVEPTMRTCQRFSAALRAAGAHSRPSNAGSRATRLWVSGRPRPSSQPG